MSKQAYTYLAWGLWVISLALVVPPLFWDPPSLNLASITGAILDILAQLAYTTVGALIASRQPRNPIGWILAVSGLLATFGSFGITYAAYGLVTHPGALPAADWLGLFGQFARTLGFFPILTYLVLLFPTGRPPSPRWRPLLWITTLAITLFALSNLLGTTLANADSRLASVASPLGVIQPESLADGLLSSSGFLLAFSSIVGCCASVVVRFRRSRGVERQQLKWLVYAALWAALMFLVVIVGVYANNPILASAVTFDLCLLGIPIAVGIAILRYRLFDIDLIINRTLVYGSLTVILAALYFGVVLGAQTLFSVFTGETKNQPAVIVVVTTLVIAALFQPLRRRIQNFIDHRFYRRKYDAARTLSRFGETLRSEVELEALHDHLLAVVEDTIQPTRLSLWLREPQQRVAPSPNMELVEGAQ